MINLLPERTVWCYSQWQPAYIEMLVSIPNVEFVKGIIPALEQDTYFQVNKRNLIVFDDRMIDAGKDQRIVNLLDKRVSSLQPKCNLHFAGLIPSGKRQSQY